MPRNLIFSFNKINCINLLLPLLRKNGQLIFNINDKLNFYMFIDNSYISINDNEINIFTNNLKNCIEKKYNLKLIYDNNVAYYDIKELIKKMPSKEIFNIFFSIFDNVDNYKITIENNIINNNFIKSEKTDLFVITKIN